VAKQLRLFFIHGEEIMIKNVKTEIPQIIHQIWSGIDEPLPEFFMKLGETWKNQYPAWKYEFWDNKSMIEFVKKFYPQYWDIYNRFPFDVQRWDAIRYLILDKIGGMYVDFDYESLEPLDSLIMGKNCCFALEPQSHCDLFKKRSMFNNALMLNTPGHPFMKKIVENVFSEERLRYDTSNKFMCVLNTTGPWILIDLYEALTEQGKKEVYLITDKYVTPFDVRQARQVRMGIETEELEACLQEAYAVHYFFNSWLVYNK